MPLSIYRMCALRLRQNSAGARRAKVVWSSAATTTLTVTTGWQFRLFPTSMRSIAQIPESVTPQQEARLRDSYRRTHLESIVPDGPDGKTPGGEWTQLIGASYDRRIYVFEVDTTAQRDDAFIAAFNDRKNVSHFNLFFNNCADFSRKVLNFYYPHAVHRNLIADTGMTTPKQDARSLTQYARRHEQIDFRKYVLPQVSGSVRRSKHIDGVVESFLKKKYVVPVAIFNPAVAGGLAAAYLLRGRYTPGQNAETLAATDLERLYLDDSLLPHRGLLAAELGFPPSATDETTGGMMLIDAGPGMGPGTR
jgi:hypothetical protein